MPIAVSSRIVPSAGEAADAQGDDDGGDQRADEEVALQEIGDRDAGQDRVREGISEEGHRAQDDVAADHGARHSDQDRAFRRARFSSTT